MKKVIVVEEKEQTKTQDKSTQSNQSKGSQTNEKQQDYQQSTVEHPMTILPGAGASPVYGISVLGFIFLGISVITLNRIRGTVHE